MAKHLQTSAEFARVFALKGTGVGEPTAASLVRGPVLSLAERFEEMRRTVGLRLTCGECFKRVWYRARWQHR
jgi:hypothetical protein